MRIPPHVVPQDLSAASALVDFGPDALVAIDRLTAVLADDALAWPAHLHQLGLTPYAGIDLPTPDGPIIGVQMDPMGLLTLSFGPRYPGFTEAFRDSVGSLAPRGAPPGYSTHFIDAARAALTPQTATERVIAGGNETSLVQTGRQVTARADYGLFEDEHLDVDVVLQALLAFREAVLRARRTGPGPSSQAPRRGMS